jgi:hypothetical protein
LQENVITKTDSRKKMDTARVAGSMKYRFLLLAFLVLVLVEQIEAIR